MAQPQAARAMIHHSSYKDLAVSRDCRFVTFVWAGTSSPTPLGMPLCADQEILLIVSRITSRRLLVPYVYDIRAVVDVVLLAAEYICCTSKPENATINAREPRWFRERSKGYFL